MKTIYLLILCLGLATMPKLLNAQCAPVLPANVSITPFGLTDSSINHPGSSAHYVCFNSVYYYYDNNPDTVFLDGSTRLIIGFSNNLTVFMRNNAQLVIDTTTSGMYDIKKIVYDTAYTTFIDTSYATIDSLISCPGMAYNYSNFSGGISPCYTMDIDKEELTDLRIFPTNTNGEINIQTSLTNFEVDIYDMVGQKILHTQDKNQVSISGQATGMYLVIISQDDKRVFTQKVFLNK